MTLSRERFRSTCRGHPLRTDKCSLPIVVLGRARDEDANDAPLSSVATGARGELPDTHRTWQRGRVDNSGKGGADGGRHRGAPTTGAPALSVRQRGGTDNRRATRGTSQEGTANAGRLRSTYEVSDNKSTQLVTPMLLLIIIPIITPLMSHRVGRITRRHRHLIKKDQILLRNSDS